MHPIGLNTLAKAVLENAIAHGFEITNTAESLALIHSEVSEALEADRTGEKDETLASGKPVGFGSELADIIIRVLHLAAHKGIDIEALVLQKMAYNRSRPMKHGKRY